MPTLRSVTFEGILFVPSTHDNRGFYPFAKKTFQVKYIAGCSRVDHAHTLPNGGGCKTDKLTQMCPCKMPQRRSTNTHNDHKHFQNYLIDEGSLCFLHENKRYVVAYSKASLLPLCVHKRASP